MPTLKAYRNGLTMGTAGRNAAPTKRGLITGWSTGAVRRHTRWLYSVEAPGLDGFGYAVTLTLKDTPESAARWQSVRAAWVERQRKRGMIRLHWVVEWQRRGTPHLHCAVYFGHELDGLERWQMVADWLDLAAAWAPSSKSQYVLPIDGALGWLQYLSKHAARGVAHYQRNGKPAGWETSGRLWGHHGSWPVDEPVEVPLTRDDYHRFRRLVRSWRVADARAELVRAVDPDAAARARRRITFARHMLRCNQPGLSAVRGVSEWIPEPVALRLLDVASRAS